jgi:hypothetical protein
MARSNGLQRSQTKSKINAVSKASLAMLNPAHAMGIETNWLDDEADDHDWRTGGSMESVRELDVAGTALGLSTYDSKYSTYVDTSPTPELAAFAISGHTDSLYGDHDNLFRQAWNAKYDGDTLAEMSSDMQRMSSGSGSFFEDDDIIENSRPSRSLSRQKNAIDKPVQVGNAATSSGSSSLSRFFTFKRSNGKPTNSRSTPVISSPCWDVPASAPPHITTFEGIEHPVPPKASLDAARAECNSVPTTPLDNLVDLPITSSSPSKMNLASRLRSMSRKSSMPSLREVRRMTATPGLQQACSARGAIASVQTALAHDPTMLPSNFPAHARVVRPANRISSVGKGARKSAFDSVISTSSSNQSIVLTAVAETDMVEVMPVQQSRRAPRKKNKCFEAVGAPTVPPLPPIGHLLESRSTETVTLSASSSFDKTQRRRSRSVDAIMQPASNAHALATLPSLVTPEGLFDTSIEKDDEPSPVTSYDDCSMTTSQKQAQRVNLSNRPTVIGISSPKLVTLSPRIGQSESSPRLLHSPSQTSAKALAAPVVVNVMPPTPDLSADGHETFDGHHASPSVRRSVEMSEAYFSYNRVILNAQQIDDNKAESDPAEKEDKVCGLPSIDDVRRHEGTHTHRRTQSTMSDLSDISSSAPSEASSSSLSDDPFGFARSLSMMSMDSNFSSSFGHGADGGANSGSDSEDEGDEAISVAHAKIVCVSPSASFSRPQLVSPRAGALMSPRGFGATAKTTSGFFSPPSSSNSSSSLHSPATGSVRSRKRDSASRFNALQTLSSVQTLASVMTTATSLHGSDQASPINEKRRSASFSDLRAPAEIQDMINSIGTEDDDCDTPRLSHGFFESLQSTRPLNVRKGSAPCGTVSLPKSSLSNAPMHISPERATQVLPTSTPGLSPTPMRPYPRAQNSSSPHLELDLSLPLDLHDIGLGFEVEEDKPRRRNHRASGRGGAGKSTRPKLPVKARSRQSVQSHDMQRSQSLESVGSQPKTPPTSSRLMASAMAKDASMGLGLDLGLEGFSQEPEQVRKLGSPPTFQAMRRTSSDSSSISVVDVLQLTEEEQSLLGKAALRSTQRVKSTTSKVRSDQAIRSAIVSHHDRLGKANLATDIARPGSSASVSSNSSQYTIRPHDQQNVYDDMTGVAM